MTAENQRDVEELKQDAIRLTKRNDTILQVITRLEKQEEVVEAARAIILTHNRLGVLGIYTDAYKRLQAALNYLEGG